MRGRWKIFYADGMVIDDHDMSAVEDVPKTGVVAIAHRTPDGIRVQRGRDYYWWTDDFDYSWYGGDIFGLWEQLTKTGSHIILFGRSIPDKLFNEIVERAAEEC
jgi:hypothetical protein